jgi:hypothetical protein
MKQATIATGSADAVRSARKHSPSCWLDQGLLVLTEPAAEHAGDKRYAAARDYVDDRDIARDQQHHRHGDSGGIPGSRIVRPADLSPTMTPPIANARSAGRGPFKPRRRL